MLVAEVHITAVVVLTVNLPLVKYKLLCLLTSFRDIFSAAVFFFCAPRNSFKYLFNCQLLCLSDSFCRKFNSNNASLKPWTNRFKVWPSKKNWGKFQLKSTSDNHFYLKNCTDANARKKNRKITKKKTKVQLCLENLFTT